MRSSTIYPDQASRQRRRTASPPHVAAALRFGGPSVLPWFRCSTQVGSRATFRGGTEEHRTRNVELRRGRGERWPRRAVRTTSSLVRRQPAFPDLPVPVRRPAWLFFVHLRDFSRPFCRMVLHHSRFLVRYSAVRAQDAAACQTTGQFAWPNLETRLGPVEGHDRLLQHLVQSLLDLPGPQIVPCPT